jgi:hypothetical protein
MLQNPFCRAIWLALELGTDSPHYQQDAKKEAARNMGQQSVALGLLQE